MRRRIAAIVLAAGASQRFGPKNKLLEEIDGLPLVAHATDAAIGAGADPVLVITGHEADAVRSALADRRVHFVHNERHRDGMGSSIAAGASALEDADGVLIVLGDMPSLRSHHVRSVLEALAESGPGAICLPRHAGQRGHPVGFGRDFFDDLARLRGDVGARALLETHPDAVVELELNDPAVLLDLDTRPVRGDTQTTPGDIQAAGRDRMETSDAAQTAIAELVGPVLAALQPEEQPAAIALAERIAAGRYRAWAAETREPATQEKLRACAAREEDIASRVEAIVPDAESIQARVERAHPDLAVGYMALFGGRSLADQFALQASLERIGARTWRALAETSPPDVREVLLQCALLEERSAEVLDSLIAGPDLAVR